MKNNRNTFWLKFLCVVMTTVFALQIQAQEDQKAKSNPLKKSDLVKALESNSISTADLIERIQNRGVDFQITEAVEKELREAGANNQIINTVSENYTEPKKKSVFGKIGGGLKKTAKVAVKTAPIVAEQLPQVQAAKATINAAKTASAEVEKEEKAAKIDETNGTTQKTTPKQNGGNLTGLKVGEYACTGSGGQMMIGLGFKVLSGNRFTDLDGGNVGTFTISDGKVTFRGGHLDGIIGRDLKDYWFVVGSQASCGPFN